LRFEVGRLVFEDVVHHEVVAEFVAMGGTGRGCGGRRYIRRKPFFPPNCLARVVQLSLMPKRPLEDYQGLALSVCAVEEFIQVYSLRFTVYSYARSIP